MAQTGRAKAIFSKLDHLSIYLLIAGTYTPFTLVTLRDSVGWTSIWRYLGNGVLRDYSGFDAEMTGTECLE